MIIGTCIISFDAGWVHSLKEKRSVVKGITERIRNKFNVSIAEIDNQDILQSIVVGFACVTNERAHADSVIRNIINFAESCTDAVIVDIRTEIL